MPKKYNKDNLDPRVIPMVEFFNENGLPTEMSCQGHNTTTMSMFWISFDKSVTAEDIIRFQRQHLNRLGGFSINGRFVARILAWSCGVEYSWEYMAATIEAADEDLKHWKEDIARANSAAQSGA